MTSTYPRFYKNARDGIWYVELARNKRKSLKTTDDEEARGIFEQIKKQLIHGSFIQTFGVFPTLTQFIELYITDRVKDHSKDTIRADALALRMLRKHVGDISLDEITKEKLEEFRDSCIEVGVSKVSINTYFRHIKAALRFASKKKLVPEFLPEIPFFKLGKVLPRFLVPTEIDRLLEKAKKTRPDFYRMLVFYLYTGCRRQEALNLTWDKVFLHDTRSFAMVTGKGNKERSIPLLPEVVEVLKPYHKEQGLVFPKIHKDTVSDWFHETVTACNPPIKARLHDLRHTCASYMLMKGIPMFTVQAILGHEHYSTTSDNYGHIITDAVFGELEKLDFKSLKGTGGKKNKKLMEGDDLSNQLLREMEAALSFDRESRRLTPLVDGNYPSVEDEEDSFDYPP